MHDIVILDARMHEQTGYVEVDVAATDGKLLGPRMTYGCCTHEIKLRYGGSLESWLQYVKITHQSHAGFHDEVMKKVLTLKGKTL